MGEMTWLERLRQDFGGWCFRAFLWANKITQEQYFDRVAIPTSQLSLIRHRAMLAEAIKWNSVLGLFGEAKWAKERIAELEGITGDWMAK